MNITPSYVKLAGKKCQIIDSKFNNYNYITKKIEFKDQRSLEEYHSKSPEKILSLSRRDSEK